MTEHDLQNLIRMELSRRGWCVFRLNVGRVKTADGRWFDTGLPNGTSDLMAIKDGRVVFLEVKTETGSVRKDQVQFINTMREIYGCVTGVVRSVEDAVKLCGEVT